MREKYEKELFSTSEFNKKYYYDGEDLGCTYTKQSTHFRLWAPTASKVVLKLYEQGLGDNLIKDVLMKASVSGTWEALVEGDLSFVYYTYEVTVNNITNETMDPYAKAAGANGIRAMVLDLNTTNPKDWADDRKPAFECETDAVIYELHIRDLSMDKNSGIKNAGKYLGLAEEGTISNDGLPTGLDHMKELGITHVHLLPVFDYHTVDETKLDVPQFNWGYDPENYNLPEGSYSTDPFQGEVRIKEFKQMVQALHRNGIRVVMDVVYNHTFANTDSNFHKLVPEYYHRVIKGKFIDGSACGNEVASERAMVRKFIVDSVKYWSKEFHIDGFRFDLMALHDIETMNIIRNELDRIDPSIITYGEGWTANESALPKKYRASKDNTAKLNRIGIFSDDMRDAIKGSVFDGEDIGYVSGAKDMEELIKFGIVASTEHEGVEGIQAWTHSPKQCINYTSVHDNYTLWDKLSTSRPDASEKDRVRMNKLSAAIILTSQGVPLFLAGEEILRSKPCLDKEGVYDANSYVSPDAVNSIKWNNKKKYYDVYQYYRGLIALRKEHPAFRMQTEKDIQTHLEFLTDMPEQVVGYRITGEPNGETAKEILVIFNASKNSVNVPIEAGEWNIYVDADRAGTEVIGEITKGMAKVEPISALVLVR
ncbi:MAG TPA: type I pullulanase [Lachnospiraceae bacterium]|nr:type I pullulanase [Lachnospiraceae bacterium]